MLENMFFVMPDTNCVYGQLAARDGALWLSLVELSKQPDVVFAVAEVTLRELGVQLEREMRKASDKFEGGAADLRALGFDVPSHPDLEAQRGQLLAARLDRVRAEILEAGGRILPLMGSIDGLLERSLNVRRPFSEKDRGFRDALLWEAALQLVSRSHEVVLISNDRRAFEGDEAERLHPALERELQAATGAEDTLTLVRSSGKAIERVSARSSAAQKITTAMQRDGYVTGEAMCALAKDAADWEIRQPELLDEGHDDEVLGVRVEAAHDPVSFSIDAVVPRADGRFVVEVGCEFGADLQVRGEDMYASYESLVGGGEVEDIGVGLVDDQLHLHVTGRRVRLLGELTVTVEDYGLVLEHVRLVNVRLSPESPMATSSSV